MNPLDLFSPATRTWFAQTFGAPSPPQAEGWPVIARGEHALLLAPTGSGKTLAAFLWCLDRLVAEAQAGSLADGVQVLYVSPLKALVNDVSHNLEQPLDGIRRTSRELGLGEPSIAVGLRTGDTPPRERARLARRPPQILCTTPESLYLLLTSAARASLSGVRYVIVDEIHALAGNKRGVHLALTLERLEAEIARSGRKAPVRIGLSATQKPLATIASFLGGVARAVTIVDAGGKKALDLAVDCPVEDLRQLPESSVWPALGPYLARLVEGNRTTLVFVNDRRSAERLCTSINDALGRPAARAHHGAMSRRAREEVEAQLKAGALPALVCTSSLELGIDVGSVDLVVQVSSPGGVARAIQRIGRAGHVLHATSAGRLVARYRGDLVECAALTRAVLDGDVEPTRVPEKCLDVLAQQVVAMCAVGEWRIEELLAVVRRAWPYRDLARSELEAVLEMLGGRYPAEEFADLRPRIVWDRPGGVVRGRPGSLRLAVTSGGTIPDKGLYPVELGDGGPRLGELDEEFVYESRVGDVFQLGSGTWRIERIGLSRVTVSPAPGELPQLPFWHGEGPGRSAQLGDRVGALCRRFEEEPQAAAWLERDHLLSAAAARNLTSYLAEQRSATGALPTDRRIVIEHFVDDVGDARIAVHTPAGKRVTTPLGLLLARRLAEQLGVEPSWVASDDGVLLRLPAAEQGPPADPLAALRGLDVEHALVAAVGSSTLFGSRFRENAARALLLPRRSPGQRTPLYLQRLRAQDLLEVARRHPDFPVLVETYRECLRDAWDVPRLQQLLADVESGRTEVLVRESRSPSPFAASLLFGFVISFMYGDDLPRAERRAQLLPVGRGLLAGLLGQDELRDLVDPVVLADEEARATRTAPQLRARSGDELHDLLRRLGPLDADEAHARVTAEDGGAAWLDELIASKRAVAEDGRWLAAEDVARYAAARAGDTTAIEALTRRALRAAGPQTLAELAARARLEVAQVQEALRALVTRGDAAEGRFRPGERSDETEYADAGLAERLHRRSLAAARRAVRPVDADRYADFLLRWHHMTAATRQEGAAGLDRALDALAGFVVPGELAEREILARRLRTFDPAWLDRKIADGEWVFRCALTGNAKIPRVAFWPRSDMAAPLGPDVSADTAEGRVLEHLWSRGASFFNDLWTATDLDAGALADALWNLLGAGLATNDRFEAVRRGRPAVGPEHLASYRAQRASRVTPRFQSGRWSLVGAPPGDAEWWAARLLDRYGVVSREHVAVEKPPVPWRELLDIYKRLELKGEVRRGYFVDGLGGAQFAWPAAVELLRADAPVSTVLVSACDPACAWGTLMPVPLATGLPDGGAVARLSSNFLVIDHGRPQLVLELGARRLRVTGSREPDALARSVAALATLQGTIEVEEVDGVPVGDTPLLEALRGAGFERDGARMRRSPLRVRPLGTS